jgi:hypothetical protein
LIEALVYLPLFKDKKNLWQFLGKEMSEENLSQYSRKLAQIPLAELGPVFTRLDLSSNINDINELYKKCLFWLSSSVQEQFFPTVYQFLDFSTMYSRFYSLFARVQKRADLYAIQLFYPEGFAWVQDIVWQEDFVYVAKRINDEKILTASGEKIWLENSVKLFS